MRKVAFPANCEENPIRYHILLPQEKGASMKLRTCVIVAAIIGVFGFGVAATQAEMVWNLTDDFSTVNNPNGVWSCGLGSGHLGWSSLPVFEDWTTARGTPGLGAWERSAGAYDPGVTYNTTGSSASGFGFTWGPHEVALDSYLGGEYTVGWPIVRFTAPADGLYNWSVTWHDLAGGGSSTTVWCYSEATAWYPLGAATSGTYSYPTPGLGLLEGETVCIVAAGPGTVTGVDMTVTTVPEPGTLVLLASGVIGLGAYVCRRRE
jgi:hypothetical protein